MPFAHHYDTEKRMGKVMIPVGGMHCQHCVKSVKDKLSAMPGVEAVDVNLEKGEVSVSGSSFDVAKLRNAIEDLGFDAGDPS